MTSQANLPHVQQPVLEGKQFSFTPEWFRFFHEVWTRIGADKSYGLGGQLNYNVTQVGNVGAGEDDLMTFSLQKNVLGAAGSTLMVASYGSFANNTNNKELALYLGATEIFNISGSGADVKNIDWYLQTVITRTGSAAQQCVSTFTTSTLTKTQIATGTEDFATALTIKCTGEATSNDDITQKGQIINLNPR